MRIALIQSNPLVGDLQGNRLRLQEQCLQAFEAGAELALAPELALWGYPPRDLLLQPSLQQQQDHQLQQLSKVLPPGLGLLLGVVETNGQRLFNAMALQRPRASHTAARRIRLEGDEGIAVALKWKQHNFDAARRGAKPYTIPPRLASC